MWRHLTRAYGVGLTLIPKGAALILDEPDETVVIVDEQGDTPLEDFEHPKDCVYVFGRTHQNDLIDYPHHHSVVITYPGSVCLFGVQAAAILLEDRKRKHGRND